MVNISSPQMARQLESNLHSEGIAVRRVGSVPQMFELLHYESPAVLVLDMSICRGCERMVVSAIHHLASNLRLIAYSAESYATDAAAVEAGVYFYAAGMDLSRLEEAIHAALSAKR